MDDTDLDLPAILTWLESMALVSDENAHTCRNLARMSLADLRPGYDTEAQTHQTHARYARVLVHVLPKLIEMSEKWSHINKDNLIADTREAIWKAAPATDGDKSAEFKAGWDAGSLYRARYSEPSLDAIKPLHE